MRIEDRVIDKRNDRAAVVVEITTHYAVKDSAKELPYSDPIVTIQYVEDGAIRLQRMSNLYVIQPVEGIDTDEPRIVEAVRQARESGALMEGIDMEAALAKAAAERIAA